MQIETSYGIEFAPNRSKQNLLMLYVLCGLFISIGLGMLIAGLQGDGDLMPGGFAMAGFATALLLIGHFFTAPRNVSYYVGKDNLVLKQGKKILTIPYGEVESITHLQEKKAEEFILQLQNKMVDRQREIMGSSMKEKGAPNAGGVFGSIKEMFKEQRRAFEKYKFLSVAVSYSSSGRQRGPEKASGADLPCDTIFILQKSGEGYLISPLNIEGFMNETKKYFSS